MLRFCFLAFFVLGCKSADCKEEFQPIFQECLGDTYEVYYPVEAKVECRCRRHFLWYF